MVHLGKPEQIRGDLQTQQCLHKELPFLLISQEERESQIQLQKASVSTGMPHKKTEQKVEEAAPLSQKSMPHLTFTIKDKIL